MRVTSITPVYDAESVIFEYRISVDNGATEGNSVSANLIIDAADIDIISIAEVCKQKLRETVK